MRSEDYRLRQYSNNANMPRGCVNYWTIGHPTMHYFGIPKQTRSKMPLYYDFDFVILGIPVQICIVGISSLCSIDGKNTRNSDM